MARLPHTSRHRVNGKIVDVARKFDQAHLDAHYHLSEWGEHSTSAHPLLGRHGHLLVEHVEGAPIYGTRIEDGAPIIQSGSATHGPEFKVSWPDGSSVTMLCADTVRLYLEHHGVAE